MDNGGWVLKFWAGRRFCLNFGQFSGECPVFGQVSNGCPLQPAAVSGTLPSDRQKLNTGPIFVHCFLAVFMV